MEENKELETLEVLPKTPVATINIKGVVIWGDNNDEEGIRPDSINVSLMDGDKKLKHITVKATDNWEYDFGSFDDNISYTVVADKLENYDTISSQNYNIVANKLFPITMVINWNDNDNEDGIRPDSVIARISQDGITVKEIEITKDDNWFGDFGRYKPSEFFDYSVLDVEGYEANVGNGFATENHVTASEIKNNKLRELDSNCNTMINSEVPVKLSTGTESFIFTELVQRDLSNAYASATALLQVGHPEVTIPFYNHLQICSTYLPSDIVAIYMALGMTKTYALTLLHQLEDQINNSTDIEYISNIKFDVSSLDESHLEAFNVQIKAAQDVIDIISKAQNI